MMDKPIRELQPSDLDDLYRESDDSDKRIFSEMRTNLQLVAGQHYNREGSRYWSRIRDNAQLTNEQRIKLTKNHLGRITTLYRNGIQMWAPDVGVFPANEKELADQKAAELHTSYLRYTKDKNNWQDKKANWLKNFVEIGEIACKIFWDPGQGNILGYEAELDDNKQPQMDESGQPILSDKPVYGGIVKFETIRPWDLKREPAAETLNDSPYLIITKLVPVSRLYSLTSDKELIQKLVNKSSGDEYKVFDNNTGTYTTLQGQVTLKEIYWRPGGQEIPNGYFKIWTSQGILAEGELPGGIFPIVTATFEMQTGGCRGYSIIRPLRPCQVEINRMASKMAEHQVTLGDDKVYIQNGGKLSQGGMLPGIRWAGYTGAAPTVSPGRTGEQYLEPLSAQINELYQLANLQELMQEERHTNDLMTELYKSTRYKSKFSLYGQRFEGFLRDVVITAIQIAKFSASEQDVINVVGKGETLNVSEFKKSEDIGYEIRVESQSEDVESQMGKQIMLTNLFQYVGTKLDKEDIGKLARLSPFLNKEQIFGDFTRNYDRATNDILALDRGIPRPARPYDDHDYMIERISGRMGEPDFEFLPFDVQGLYQEKLQEHEQFKARAIEAERAAEAGFIPSGGYLVTCDFYITKADGKTERLRVSSEALNWLVKRLEAQSGMVQPLADEVPGVRQDLANMINPSPAMGAGGGSLLDQLVTGA